MPKNISYKVGDKIIEFDRIFEIFKIEYIKDQNGKKEETMFYKTYFVEEVLNPITCSLPVKNLDLTDIRKPVSKKELGEILKRLKKGKTKTLFSNVDQIKDLLKTNDLYDVVKAVKILQKEKRDNQEKFNKNKKDLLVKALKMIAQEYAIINKISLETAEQKIQEMV